MKTGSWVLDSSALLAYLKREEGYKSVKAALLAANSGEAKVLMNEINLGEVYCVIAKQRSSTAAESFIQEKLPLLPIEALPTSLADVIAAAKLKINFDLHYMDAFVAATAIREKAGLLTCDPDFQKVEKEVKIRWLR